MSKGIRGGKFSVCPGRQGLTGLLWDCETGTQHPRHKPASAPGLRTINTRRLWQVEQSKMGKMKKGKAHHWYKEEKDKVPKKSYVPTGETTWLGYFSNNGFCPQESLEVVQRRLPERQNPSTCPRDYRGAGSQDKRMPPKNEISTDSSVPSIIVEHNSVSKFIK